MAADSAVFGLAGARLGRLPLDGGIVTLARPLPTTVAMETLHTGGRPAAADAVHTGAITEAVTATALDSAADRGSRRCWRDRRCRLHAIKQVTKRTEEGRSHSAILPARMTSSAAPVPAGQPSATFEGVTVTGLPPGYAYMVTRYADIILRDAFPEHWRDLLSVLGSFKIEPIELWIGGGGRSLGTQRLDDSLRDRGWSKHNIHVKTEIDGQIVTDVRGHEIDMFKLGPGDRFPGIGEETEWNNKDPFFDRDLANFYTLHRAGALAVGVIVTRGPTLQAQLKEARPWTKQQIVAFATSHGLVLPDDWRGPPAQPYGPSSTHWEKLVKRVRLGGGGECPLFLVGIEPGRVTGPVAAPSSGWATRVQAAEAQAP